MISRFFLSEEVDIFNHHFAILEHEDTSYLKTLAAEVDARIHTLCAASEKISPLRATNRAAYQFADDASQKRGKKGTERGPSS